MMFGSGPVEFLDERERPSWWTNADARAAQVQSEIAEAVLLIARRREIRRRHLSEALGVDARQLYRLLNGESWMSLRDLVVMSSTLGFNLLEYRSTIGAEDLLGDMVPAAPSAIRGRRRSTPEPT